MGRLTWLGALLGVLAVAPRVFAQDGAQGESEVEPGVVVITEPPPQLEPPPEPPPAEAPPEQPPPEPEKPEEPLGHLRVGGGIGFGLGSGFTSIAIAPQVSYIFKRIVEPGVSMRYQYSKDRTIIPEVVWHTYGGSLFVRLFPIQQLFFLVEGEIINTGWKTGDISSGRTNYGNLLLGGGYMMGLGKGAFMGLSMKFAIFRNPFYPNAYPIVGIGAGYAF